MSSPLLAITPESPSTTTPKSSVATTTTTATPQPQKPSDATTPHKREKVDIWDQPITAQNWYKHVNYTNVIVVILIPIYGFYMALSGRTELRWETAVWGVVYYFLTGLGITAGYHRLWSHTSYSATKPVQVIFAALGGGAVQGSIRWWGRNHRAHHRFVDTAKDPYSVQLGILYAHMGWFVLKQNPHKIGRVDITDFNNSKIVMWQHRYFPLVAIFMGLVFPCMVAGLGWGDWFGGLIYAGIIRLCVVQQATFCVNSLAHWLGDQPFDDKNSPRDHVITALVTLGEGYHNFHHEFPSDYRNAIRWYQYDPTKWLIWTLKKMHLASDLKTFPQNEIEKGLVQQQQKQIDLKRATLDWGIPLEDLPLISWDDYLSRSKAGEALVLVAGVVHDVSRFVREHPGGKILITSMIGRDATAVFNGGVYEHSNAAHNLLGTMRIGVLRGGCEVEIWKVGGELERKKEI